MRLIDANALTKALEDYEAYSDIIPKKVYEIIDNTPTIVVRTKIKFEERNNENGKLQRRKG